MRRQRRQQARSVRVVGMDRAVGMKGERVRGADRVVEGVQLVDLLAQLLGVLAELRLAPLLGGANARTQAGLDDETEGGPE